MPLREHCTHWLTLPALAVVTLLLLSWPNANLEECNEDVDDVSYVQKNLLVSRLAGLPDAEAVPAVHLSIPLVREEIADALYSANQSGYPMKARPWWHPLTPRSRYARRSWQEHQDSIGIQNFFASAEWKEWCSVLIILPFFLVIQYYLQEWPSRHKYHAMALLIWFAFAAAINLWVLWRKGPEEAEAWFSGYMLEFVFSIENVFVFHIVVRAFRVPRRHAQKALVIVVAAQIVFELVFFMGLAWAIRSSNILPYILGVWLIYVGYLAGCEGSHSGIDFKETWVYTASNWILGERLMFRYRKTDLNLISCGEKGLQISMLFLATVALVVTDFVLEVDVVLTKVEELQSPFLAFTSSAVAAFTVPELFFISRDLFARFYLLKFGVSFVLVFFGIQLLLHEFFAIPTIFQILITIAMMLICVLLSWLLPLESKSDLDADEEEFEANFSASDGENSAR